MSCLHENANDLYLPTIKYASEFFYNYLNDYERIPSQCTYIEITSDSIHK